MPLSSVTRVSDGIQKQYDFDFGYLRKSHVFVFVNNELRSFKWLGPFQIELLNFPQPDDTVTIRRLTDRVNRITTFTDGQTILAEDLNAADLQTFYIAQEMLDQIEERILAGEVAVIGSGYITAQWIQEQLAANIAGSTQFQAISDALDNEALERANALAAEAAARAAEIAAEAAARGAAVFDLEQADLEAGQRLDVLEAEVDDPDTGIKARLGTLETVTVDLENNKADASAVSAIQAAVDAAEAQITTIDEALATETAARTSQINAANSRIDGAEATLTSLEVTVTNLATNKAEASELTALEARVGAAEAGIISESSARASGDSANATTIEQNRAAFQRQQDFPNLLTDAELSGAWQNYWDPASDRDYPGLVMRGHNHPGWFVPGVRNVAYDILYTTSTTDGFSWASRRPKPQYRPKVQEGDRVYASIRAAGHRLKGAILLVVFWNASGSVIGVEQFSNYDPTYFAFGAVGAARESFALISGLATAPAGAATADIIVWFVTKGAADTPYFPYGWWTEPMLSRVEPSFSGTIPWSRQAASVTSLKEALATGSSSVARLLLGVNTTTNVATIEAVAAEGEGVWNGAAITLQADLIRLLARNIDFGTRTQFEDTRGTLYNTEAGLRLRILGPFGASNDLVLWYGSNSVPLQSETKTNGIFAIPTDGKVYLGSAPLNQGIGVTPSTSSVGGSALPGQTAVTNSVSFTVSGGTAPYSWQFLGGPYVPSIQRGSGSVAGPVTFQKTITSGENSEEPSTIVFYDAQGRTGSATITVGFSSSL